MAEVFADPALVYSEIIAVIKGSEETLTQDKRHISKELYEKLSNRQQSTLSGRTAEVYELFLAYTHMKVHNREYDAADRTHRILSFLEKHSISGTLVDHLYVDEVQDNLLIDTMGTHHSFSPLLG